MPKKKVIQQKYRKNCQLLDEICKDALDRIRNDNTRSLGVHLQDVTNDDKIKYISFYPSRNKYTLAYHDPVYFPGTKMVGQFASTRQAAEVQQFIWNQLFAISDQLTIANDVALHNTKTATIDPLTNKRLPDFANIGSNGSIFTKKYDEYVSDLKSLSVPSRKAYNTRVSTFHADRGTGEGGGNWARGNQLKKERVELLREEEKNDRKRGCQKFPCKKNPKRQHKLITEDSSDRDRPTIEIDGNFVDADPTTGTILYPGTKLTRRLAHGRWCVEIVDFESWIVMDGNAGKTYKEYEVFYNILDLSNPQGDFNCARQTISAMVKKHDVNIAITELFTESTTTTAAASDPSGVGESSGGGESTTTPTRQNGNSSKRICYGPKRDEFVVCPYSSSLNVKFADVQQRDQTSPFKANTSQFVSGFLQGDHDNDAMWENNSKLEDCEKVGYIAVSSMRMRKFNKEEFDGQCVEPRCPYCHIMITADDWSLKIRLDGTNEYRQLKSRMIDEQECWCAGEGDRKGAGKTKCPHTDFFDREIAKCITDSDEEKLIMGWFIFDHETPMWLAVPPVATTATTPSTATAPAVVSPPTNTRLSLKEHQLARLRNDRSKFCDPETGLPLEAGFIRCRACNYVATQKIMRTRGKQKGIFFYDAVEWFQDQLQIPFYFDRPTPVNT